MKRESWGSQAGFILSVAGSAIGLANIWRFPYVVGQYGGAAFILMYLFFLFMVGIPVLISEILIGRSTQTSPAGAFEKIGGSKSWGWAGKMTILTGFLVSAFYSAVAGWIFGYLIEAVSGNLHAFSTPLEAAQYYEGLVGNPYWGVFFHFLFLLCCIAILYFGVRGGIERGNKIMMPTLFVMMVALVIKGLMMPNAGEALTFLFSPNWSLLTPSAILLALGQAFFTLSLGQGTMVTYGSYLCKKTNILGTIIPVVVMDTVISLMSAVAIFTIVFSVGMQPDSGPGLIFHTLPWVFSQVPGGFYLGILFFLLVTLAAMTSEISALEPAIAYLRDQRGWGRHSAVFACGAASFMIGVPCALSFSLLKDTLLFGMNVLDFMAFICSSIMIPLGGLFAVLLTGWVWGFANSMVNLSEGNDGVMVRYPWLQRYFWISFKFTAPLLIMIVFISALGFFDFTSA